jgi:hypothetical protein
MRQDLRELKGDLRLRRRKLHLCPVGKPAVERGEGMTSFPDQRTEAKGCLRFARSRGGVEKMRKTISNSEQEKAALLRMANNAIRGMRREHMASSRVSLAF